jgi:hypothetical protein
MGNMIWLDAVALEDFLQNYLWLVDENGESLQKPKYMEQLVSNELLNMKMMLGTVSSCKACCMPIVPATINLDQFLTFEISKKIIADGHCKPQARQLRNCPR